MHLITRCNWGHKTWLAKYFQQVIHLNIHTKFSSYLQRWLSNPALIYDYLVISEIGITVPQTSQLKDSNKQTMNNNNNNFYCGPMVHITDTRAQKVVSYTSAHITETVFAHGQLWEEQIALSSPQLYRHSQEHRKWITNSRALHNRCYYVSNLERSKTLSQHFLLFFNACVYTVSTYFYYTKAKLMRRKYRDNSRTTTAFGLHHTGALNNWGKMKICKKHQTFEAIE